MLNDAWEQDRVDFDWQMPVAPWWKRLPIIRHVRAMRTKILIERWYAFGPGTMGLRSGYDDWVVTGMWHGKEREEKK